MMTSEEAIDILEHARLMSGFPAQIKFSFDAEGIEALEMAIKALEQQPSEDCISREAVKEMLSEEWNKYMPMELDINLSFVLEKISELPSVTPSYNSIKTELKPDADCISRVQALHACCDEWNKDYKAIMKSIRQLPSVTPQPKIGKWEYVQYDSNPNIGNWHCSECRGICTEMHSIEDAYNYCPNCGAKMQEVEE